MLIATSMPKEKRQHSPFRCGCLTFSGTYKTHPGKTPLAYEENIISLPICYSPLAPLGKEILEISASASNCRKPRLRYSSTEEN